MTDALVIELPDTPSAEEKATVQLAVQAALEAAVRDELGVWVERLGGAAADPSRGDVLHGDVLHGDVLRGDAVAVAQMVLMLPMAALATVELADRMAVGAALTRLKARMKELGVRVRLTGRSPVPLDTVSVPTLLDEAALTPDPAPAWDVFLAYASPDRDRVAALQSALEAHGLRVFRDQAGVAPGQDWPFAIANAQRTSRATVACLSDHSDGATFFRGEILRALQWRRTRGHRLVPVGLDGVPPVDALPEGLQTIQVLDLPGAGGTRPAAAILARTLRVGS